jgi:hypothetical protein
MTTSYLDISAALDSNLNTFATANSIVVAWENKDYQPVTGTLYLRPTLLPADTESIGLGNTSSEDHLGIYQVDVIAPIDKGKGQAITKADLVKTAFPKGNLTYNGLKLRIRSVSRGSGSRDGAYYIVPVFISYHSIT